MGHLRAYTPTTRGVIPLHAVPRALFSNTGRQLAAKIFPKKLQFQKIDFYFSPKFILKSRHFKKIFQKKSLFQKWDNR